MLRWNVCVCVRAYVHDVKRHGGGQALGDVFEEIVGGEKLRGAGGQVLL